MKNGNLSINSENIFPVIKKWLYSDHDIFVRELISNGCDAVTKLKKLSLMGEFDEPDEPYRIDVTTSANDKTITFTDNGIGMTEEEVEKYINQIAFSGAEAFLEQYKDKATEEQIIGHFGLGFYSAFMVADKVTIETKSYKDGEDAVYWECEDGLEYSMKKCIKADRGTTITLYLNEDSYEFANEYRIKEVIDKYCSFMPVEIYYTNADEPQEDPKDATVDVDAKEVSDTADNAEGSTDSKGPDADDIKTEEKKPEAPKPLNTTTPLWAKHPNDCTDEEYKEFYRKVFHDYKEPLFWIHLNMDYPFNLKGILYFPKINTQYDNLEGTIKLYNNQVFVADNIKEVIPEFLMLLKGCIDCPDLPLNVSRSALQNDGFVKKISDYITKKVADKLSGMYKTHREDYEKYWDDINPFIKFGCLKDLKFLDKMKDFCIYKNLEGKYITLPEYLEAGKEKYENKVFYVTDEQAQSQYINMFKAEGMDALIMTQTIDSPFITLLEQKNENVHFYRIDAELSDNFVGEELSEETAKEYKDKLTATFEKALDMKNLNVKVESLKDENTSSILTQPEETRRMQEMMKMYGMAGMDPSMFGQGEGETLILNSNNKLVKYVLDNPDSDNTATICCQLYDLAVLANRPLSAEAMTKFIARSNEILGILTK
ncbi:MULTISPECIES: molecular chaperone HtpG [Coprococcus]|mgnify:FL=1|jgi:molecular chaperone HtpG|uniref:molecular chaperone HtpG n=1 Tax=Coprococcus TaxID=33042 RepID=UPI000E40A841|nr:MULTISPECIES: molecular chaperone HtpG [Coprococcus]RGD41254.1 molecular chaperone HtpG [Coprococcus sp. AM14-16]RHR66447.1 molecular chaperone HtpG [Coprococcus sp. AF16-5]RHU54119.1 molecular chaperone HtpG [Coprococcus sp. TF11-13]RJW74295.1 molecular chaperone HtpG [Coprococcus sp. AF38-1]